MFNAHYLKKINDFSVQFIFKYFRVYYKSEEKSLLMFIVLFTLITSAFVVLFLKLNWKKCFLKAPRTKQADIPCQLTLILNQFLKVQGIIIIHCYCLNAFYHVQVSVIVFSLLWSRASEYLNTRVIYAVCQSVIFLKKYPCLKLTAQNTASCTFYKKQQRE